MDKNPTDPLRQAFSDSKITAADCRMHRNAQKLHGMTILGYKFQKISGEGAQPLPKPHPRRRLRRLDLGPPFTNPGSALVPECPNPELASLQSLLSAVSSTSQFQEDQQYMVTSPRNIRHARIKHRRARAEEMKSSFQSTVPSVLH